MLTSIRHLRRNRSVSIGPQSEADAYETLAYRERRRKESLSSAAVPSILVFNEEIEDDTIQPDNLEMTSENKASDVYHSTGSVSLLGISAANGYRKLPSCETALSSPSAASNGSKTNDTRTRCRSTERYEKEHKDVFSKLEKPRVRYDVEVITKLVVYTGIG